MENKKILSWISILLGEALIIAAFIVFRGNTTDQILVQNIIVTSIIYGLFFIDFLVSWVGTGDKSQRKIGTIGIRWIFTWMYTILAIAAMIVCNTVLNLAFPAQLIIHGVLIFLLLLGFFAASHSSSKINKAYGQEKANRNGIMEMEKAMRNLKDKMNGISELPEYFTSQINTLDENLRYISPANNPEAFDLEKSFAKALSDIEFAISNFSMNEEAIVANLKTCDKIFNNRKHIHSN